MMMLASLSIIYLFIYITVIASSVFATSTFATELNEQKIKWVTQTHRNQDQDLELGN